MQTMDKTKNKSMKHLFKYHKVSQHLPFVHQHPHTHTHKSIYNIYMICTLHRSHFWQMIGHIGGTHICSVSTPVYVALWANAKSSWKGKFASP